MIDNYAKPAGRGSTLGQIFLFDYSDPGSRERALDAARAHTRDGTGTVAVWRQLEPMRDDVQCVGHAPGFGYQSGSPLVCVNCGQPIRSERRVA